MLVRGYLVNEFDEKVGCYDVNGTNEYSVNMYHSFVGFMTEEQITSYAEAMGLYLEESKVVIKKSWKSLWTELG